MKARQSFTLVEVVVAVAITAVLMTTALTVVVRVLTLWERSAGRLQVESQARLILDQLEADLTSIVWRRDGGRWLFASIQPDPDVGGHAGMAGEDWTGTAKPGAAGGSLRLEPDLRQCRFGQAGVWLQFFTVAPVSAGDLRAPAAVAYQLVRRTVGGETPSYQLFRSQVPARVCATAGYHLGPGSVYEQGDATPDSPGNLRRPPVDSLLATDVLDFGVRFSREQTDGSIRWLFPTAGAMAYEARGHAAFPTQVEVFVRLARPEGLRRLGRWERGEAVAPDGEWWRCAEDDSLVFARWIRLPMEAH
jgi:hypothetical protein